MNLIINTDGASRGNPGPASYGYVIKDQMGVILHQKGETLGVTTNNVAEYTAVLKALDYVKQHFSQKFPNEVEVIADSELIVRQLSGSYKIRNINLKKIYDQIKKIEPIIGNIRYRSVPRKENFIADRLANQALDLS